MVYYINVAVYTNIDNLLTYKIEGDSEPETGVRVLVPLGKKIQTGIIIEVLKPEKKPVIDINKIKFIKEIIDEKSVLNNEMIKLGLWISDYYICAPGIVFSTMLSALFKIKSKRVIKFLKDAENLNESQKQIVDMVKSKGEVSLSSLIRIAKKKNIYNIINELEKKGIFEVKEEEQTYGIKKKEKEAEKDLNFENETFELTDEQKKVLDKINENIGIGEYKTFLLYGITGSGKTEIYIRAAEETIKKGKKVIILIPEIFLTPQILEKFKKVFKSKIAIYHSALKNSERLAEWKKMKNGEVDIVIGTRSAVFAPFENLGLIVVDEEFDTSYKQENDPKYNARDVAVYRGFVNNATVILGSATPSIESYYNALLGKYELLSLSTRIKNRKMPEIKMIDLKFEKDFYLRNKILSEEFVREMENALENNEQIILFINRRGFSNYVICYKCGLILKCKNCDIPLTFHKEGNILRCHYCDNELQQIIFCPVCKNKLFYRGIGTQKVEDIIQKFFPDKKIARIDIDSMKKKKLYFEMYEKIKRKEIDILIGTQMIAKGFDFPEVTFVGVVNIDNILNLPDFRAEERVFQLLTQVAGRCGRGEKEGKVIIQTFTPDSSALKYIKDYKIDEFYKTQLDIRKLMNYPPFASLLHMIIYNSNKEKAEKQANEIREKLEKFLNNNKILSIKILGPAEAPLFKLRNKYRFSIILKSKSKNDLNKAGKYLKSLKNYDTIIAVDPVSMM